MNNSKFAQVIGIAAAIIIIFLLIDNDKKSKKIKELKKEIEENENLTAEIKKQLRELIQNNTEIDPKIANELGHIAALLEIKQDTSAVLKLTKIIETLLKELYKGDEKVKEIAKQNKRTKPAFADYLEHAKCEKIFSNEDYHLLIIMKSIRNEEAHELDVKKEKSRVLASFICGFSVVLGLSKRLKKKGLDKAA